MSGHFHTLDNFPLDTFSSLTIWQNTSRVPCMAGQLQHTRLPHESFMICPKATVVCAYIKRAGRGTEFTRRPFFVNSKLHKVARLNEKAISRTVLDKTHNVA